MKQEIRREDDSRDEEAGFTLVEVMVVMVIIGLMMGFVAMNVLPALGKAEVTKAKADIRTLTLAVENYRLVTNDYPETLNDLVNPPDSAGSYQKGGFIKANALADPWGRPYEYRYPGEHDIFDIWSFGADNQAGGEGDAADIESWNPS